MSRLPTVGGDDNTWGDILNDFLEVEHNNDGTLKNVARPSDLTSKADSSTVSGKLDKSTVTTKGDILAATGSAALTRLGVGSDGTVLTADSSQSTGVKWGTVSGGTDSNAVHFLQYDTSGATDAGSVLQSAYDAGNRTIVIPPGLFLCNTPVFFDAEDGMATTRLICDGVTFLPGSGLPTVSEWETFNTNKSLLNGTKVLFFPSTYRAALSGGVVTTVGHNVLGTATHGATKSGIHPHLIIDGGTLNAIDLTKYNAALVHTNLGGAVELRSVHMDSGRALLLTGSQYVDGNKMYNCSGWSNAGDATFDASLFYQYGSGDGVEIHGTKTAGYIWTAKMYSCNGAHISGCIGGGFKFTQCHAITIDSNHTETANNITSAPRLIYDIDSSHITINSSFDYLSNSATDGAIYLEDNGSEGLHSTVTLNNYFGRQFLDPNTSDPVGGQAIYINKMNDRSVINVHDSWCQTSASDASFGQAYGIRGLPIDGNATNEPTLSAGIAAGRDIIGSGTFKIFKYATSSLSTGQNQAMTIGIGPVGSLGRVYASKTHVTPTFYNREHYGVGSLTNGTTYAYAAALCNTLPDGSIQYGQATAEWTIAADSTGVNVTELYLPTAAGAGATLIIWRCTTTGVLSAPDRYVLMPVGSGATRIFDTGTNISKMPWITTSVPVPNTVAAANHTLDAFYLNGSPVGSLVNTNNQTGTSYTLVLADAGEVIEMNNASPITLTVPPNSSVAFLVGTVIELFQQGAGQVTVAAGAGVTIRSPSGNLKLAAQYAAASLRKRATDEWTLEGHLSS